MPDNQNNFQTLPQLISYISSTYQNPNALNFLEKGQWQHISTLEFTENIKHLALGLKEIGLEKNDGFGIVASSSPMWLMMDFAAIALSAISVPIFSNIASENLIFEIEDANVKFIFCDTTENLEILKNSKKNFKKIITYGFESDNSEVITFQNLISLGKKFAEKNPDTYQKLIEKINPEDLATIIYTSGSTGRPKGVELTHQNLISQIKATQKYFPLYANSDVVVSCLPLAHIFERMVMCYYLSCGVSIYFADDVKNVGNIMREIKPTLMTVVPRMLEKVYAKMKENLDSASFFKRLIAVPAFHLALTKDPDHGFFCRKFFDFLVYKKLRAALGGKFRMMICGGAPIAPAMERFFRNIGVNLFVGYGLTETSPVIAVNSYLARKTGTVGKTFSGVQVKLADDGELLTRGIGVMRGYHNSPEKTREMIDENGWLKTGDLAVIDTDGFIKIIGRKKELFKTANGKYVSPVPIEQKLVARSGFLAAAAIIAEGRKFVSCLLFPDFEILQKYQNKVGMKNLSSAEFLNSDFVKNKMDNLIAKVNQNLNHWEQIQKYYLAKNPISIESGELTPSMKLRRPVVEEKYRKEIEEFYSK